VQEGVWLPSHRLVNQPLSLCLVDPDLFTFTSAHRNHGKYPLFLSCLVSKGVDVALICLCIMIESLAFEAEHHIDDHSTLDCRSNKRADSEMFFFLSFPENRLRREETEDATRTAAATSSLCAAPTAPALCPRTRPSSDSPSATWSSRLPFGTSATPLSTQVRSRYFQCARPLSIVLTLVRLDRIRPS
jgi:hypothetical protein